MRYGSFIAAIGVVALVASGALVWVATGPSRFRTAVIHKDYQTIASMLKAHPEWARLVIEPRRGTALNIAVENNDEDMVRLLLRFPCDLNFAAPSTGTPLQNACFYARFEIVKALIKAGADVAAAPKVSNASGTPLQIAIRARRLEVIELLVKNGADINGVDPSGYRGPPIIQAIRPPPNGDWGGNATMLRYLFEHGAKMPDSSTLGMDGHDILYWAKLFKAPPEIVGLLKQHGATE
jgi:hypothetical protein